ncbi:helix-turn-helix domain-containing protein [Castellaniella caeni]|uniref:helix-turn-helix domain-containing protein n=1 Tax=Castellaniella caeni TaxID=266123 RepID=UPI000C9F163E|nr:helix-turn-helix transcriptional regulator [Castellaniella caeni]
MVDTFGDRLRTTRIRRGLSQAQLARACDLSQSAISAYENGSRLPKQAARLALALNVSLVWLSRGEGSADQARQTPPGSLQETAFAWPFASIEPHRFWALSTKDRQAVESTLAALIDSLQSHS